jgi:hypothetical protein
MSTHKYHGIRSIDPLGCIGLANPERGFRIETVIADHKNSNGHGQPAHLKHLTAPTFCDDWWIMDAEKFAPFGLTLLQTYCYLDDFVDKPISDEKLNDLDKALARLRKRGLKTLLRFAYARNPQKKVKTMPMIQEHLEQLEPIIIKNSDVIFVFQAGFLGTWGEWHNQRETSQKVHAECAGMVDKILDILPGEKSTQVRVSCFKRWILKEGSTGSFSVLDKKSANNDSIISRIGFHNDGFLADDDDGGTWPAGSTPENPDFEYWTNESPYVPVDGELFWGDQGGIIDGFAAAVRMRLHHFSSFSLAHSYSEREGKPYSIDNWMVTPITLEQVEKARLPVSNGYFEDSRGRTVSRTQFEYIMDHLGYRLELCQACFQDSLKNEQIFSLKVELINRGFAAPQNPRPVKLLLIGSDDNVIELTELDVDVRNWQPFEPEDELFTPLIHTISQDIALPEIAPGYYKLGLWLPDADMSLRTNPHYAIRLANRDVAWWENDDKLYGVNIFGIITITE